MTEDKHPAIGLELEPQPLRHIPIISVIPAFGSPVSDPLIPFCVDR